MKIKTFFSTLAILLVTGQVYAQHSDVELGYDNLANPTTIIIEQENMTLDCFQYFESEMEELDPFDPGNYSSDQPGFATHANEGLLMNPGDQLWIKALDATGHSAFGVGYVNYYDPVTDSLVPQGRISVVDNSGSTFDLVMNEGIIESGDNPQFIDFGDAQGDIHDHVVFDLLDDASAPIGAYGIMFELQSDFAPADGIMDVTSQPFWIIFNHGMSASDFDNLALPKYGVPSANLATTVADSVNVLFGNIVGGGLADTFDSDDSRLRVQAIHPFSPFLPGIRTEFEFTLPNDSPSVLQVVAETHVNDIFVTQELSLYNFDSGSFETIDSQSASFNTDKVNKVLAGGDILRFVEAGTGRVVARIESYAQGNGFLAIHEHRTDQIAIKSD